MEKLVENEMGKTLIILSLAIMALSALMTKLIAKISGSFKAQQKSTLVYLLVFLVFFAAIACTASLLRLKDHLLFYILFQFYFLLLGIAHTFYMPVHLKWAKESTSIWAELLFTFIAGIIGSIGFALVYGFFNKEGMEYTMASSTCTFIIPWFFYQTFQRAVDIPPKIIRQWFYPVNEAIEDPDEAKLKNLLVISFEFQKQNTDSHVTNFRAKAPTDMDFGELFYYFINDYNERHPNAKIHYSNNTGAPHGWIFYKKPKWHTLITQYINADKTIFNNSIKENDIIICRRSLN
jgi:hypothetical protein